MPNSNQLVERLALSPLVPRLERRPEEGLPQWNAATQMLLDAATLVLETIGPFSALRHRLIVLIQEATMRQYTVYEFDNRDSAQVYQYMEARIEALKRRIEQLEAEKKAVSSDLHCAQTKSSAA
jgi:hypothetical protein